MVTAQYWGPKGLIISLVVRYYSPKCRQLIGENQPSPPPQDIYSWEHGIRLDGDVAGDPFYYRGS